MDGCYTKGFLARTLNLGYDAASHLFIWQTESKMNDCDFIKAHQRAWAGQKGLSLDADGYCACVDDNIFQRLSAGARSDFGSGDGGELGKEGGRGKIRALHSSAALACNWFDYWRSRDLQPLSRAFGVPVQFSTLSLEQKFPTGLGRFSPNLDVLLTCSDGSLFAIESKFMEPYTTSKGKTYLKPEDFPKVRSLWTDAGLPGCQAIAESLRQGQQDDFHNVLDAAQLLKHILGLALSGHKWLLCCLWFEVPGLLADQHRRELKTFTTKMGADAVHFSALTYQELFTRMLPFMGQENSEYIGYVARSAEETLLYLNSFKPPPEAKEQGDIFFNIVWASASEFLNLSAG
jgi:hypothetical protein